MVALKLYSDNEGGRPRNRRLDVLLNHPQLRAQKPLQFSFVLLFQNAYVWVHDIDRKSSKTLGPFVIEFVWRLTARYSCPVDSIAFQVIKQRQRGIVK